MFCQQSLEMFCRFLLCMHFLSWGAGDRRDEEGGGSIDLIICPDTGLRLYATDKTGLYPLHLALLS